MQQMQAAPERLVAVGGGTKNALWVQVVSDITGVTQFIPERTIGAALGDAFMAGFGSGLVPDLDALNRDWVRIVAEVEPNPAVRSRYDEMFGVYLDLYQQTKTSMHRLGQIAHS
jgi:xylulokinase